MNSWSSRTGHSRFQSGIGRRRRRGENRGPCKGKRPSRREQENQWAFEVPPSAQERYGPGARISMQASGNPRCAASNRPGTPTALDLTLGAGQGKNPCRRGRVHTRKPYRSLRRLRPKSVTIANWRGLLATTGNPLQSYACAIPLASCDIALLPSKPMLDIAYS